LTTGRLVIALTASALLSCQQPQSPAPKDNYTSTQIGQVTDYDISEISGIANSKVNDNVLWVINDSGDRARIYALTPSGEILARIKIEDADNEDWEDLALFSYQGGSYLLIADTGGNTSNRDVFDLYIVAEPDLRNNPQSVAVQWRIRFQYQDEPRDCEAVAVDALEEKIYLLSKRSVPSVLYELPLRPDGNEIIIAKRLGEVNTIPQPTQDEIKTRYDKYHAQPTGLDITPNGGKITVLTYRRLFIYDRARNESWLGALNRPPLQIEFPPLKQAEAICFFTDNKSVLVTSEQIPAPILKIKPTVAP